MSDLENDRLFLTKQPSLWCNVLRHLLTFAVRPDSFPAVVCCSAGMASRYASQKSLKQWPRR